MAENVSLGISPTPFDLGTAAPSPSYTRTIAEARWHIQYRNYLAFDNGKPLAFAANKVAANCLWRDPNADPAGSVNQVLGQLWSDDNARGEYSINVIVREDKC